jgi:hypothetical protein
MNFQPEVAIYSNSDKKTSVNCIKFDLKIALIFQPCSLHKPKALNAKNWSLLEQTWAGRSVWHDRRVRNAEAAGSNPARSTFPPARPCFDTPKTLEVVLKLKKNGLAE